MLREPAVAGQFYPDSPAQLRAMIESFIDKNAEKEDVIGLVAPHAGYIYSGAVAGAVLSRVKFKDTFIIHRTQSYRPRQTLQHHDRRDLEDTSGRSANRFRTGQKAGLDILVILKKTRWPMNMSIPLKSSCPSCSISSRMSKLSPSSWLWAMRDIYKEIGHDIAQALQRVKKRSSYSGQQRYEPL